MASVVDASGRQVDLPAIPADMVLLDWMAADERREPIAAALMLAAYNVPNSSIARIIRVSERTVRRYLQRGRGEIRPLLSRAG